MSDWQVIDLGGMPSHNQVDHWAGCRRISPDDLAEGGDFSNVVLVLPSDAEIAAIEPYLGALDRIAIVFSNFADGRGFSLARLLREAGYTKILRGEGHIITDQFRHAMATGFDEIAISKEQAERMTSAHWGDVASHFLPDYQARLFKPL